jgi:hypothetical protein
MAGRLSKPMVTTVAPTIPVEAASSMPTKITDRPRPPRSRPNMSPIVSRSSSAIFERSSMIPMNTKRGTATSNSLTITPK